MLNYRMHKNILIIGYGDIGSRLKSYLDDCKISLYTLSRSAVEQENVFSYQWDWLSDKLFDLKDISFDSIIIIPKPSERNEDGYMNGFIKSLSNIEKSLVLTRYKKIIAISSTRVYGADQIGILNEEITPKPTDYRGTIIKEYEELLKSFFGNKLTILRFSGLYDERSIKQPFNKLHRNNAAKAIKFFIDTNKQSLDSNTFNCSEDMNLILSERCIDNSKLKSFGLLFEQFT